MLAIALVKELSEKIHLSGSASQEALAFFFCDNKDSRRRTASVLLRGLIWQLLCQRPDLCFHLRDQYDKQKEQLFTSSNSLQSLWRILQSIVNDPSILQTFLIIDALDECEPEAIEELLCLVDPDADFDNENDMKQASGLSKIKWLITSRDEPIIIQTLAGTMDISLEVNHLHVKQAVREFIDTKLRHLQRRKRYSNSLAEHVARTLWNKAEGTFLWVSLACRELSKPTVLSMNTKQVLERLPAGIVSLYDRILEQVLGSEDEELAAYAKDVLRSMVIAVRPLTLREMAVAAGLPGEHHQNVPVLQEYVNQCGSLITIRQDTIYFVHQSAKTYLLSNIGSVLSENPAMDHQFLSLNCFGYVCTYFKKDHSKAAQADVRSEYPILHWIDHARKAPAAICHNFNLEDNFFDGQSSSRAAWLDDWWPKRHATWETQPGDFTVLHLCAYAGLTSLAERTLETRNAIDINASDTLGNAPILWAAKNGHDDFIKVLISAGADYSSTNHEGMNALHLAAAHGHELIVRELFNYGCTLVTTDKNGWNPLHRAAYNGYTTVVRLLLDLGANIEALDGSTWTALHRAASMGQTEVIQLLLERKASIDALDREGMTPMLHAGWAGQHDAMMLLMESGADINSSDYSGCTALHNASWNGQEAAVEFLLMQGAAVDARQNAGATPLHQASWTGHAQIAKLLIQAGANTGSKDDESETPLQQAAWRGHVGTIEVLLDADVEVDMTNAVGHTALHQAASSGKQDAVRILLKHGADPTILDRHGQSARALAEVNEHDYTAGLLKAAERELAFHSTGTATPLDLPTVDPAVADTLGISRDATVQSHQAEGFFKPEKITITMNGKRKFFYMKSGSNAEMFESEYILSASSSTDVL